MIPPHRLVLKQGPAVEPVHLDEAKNFLKVEPDLTADDALIAQLIRVARETGEKFTGRAWITQTWTMFMDAWPSATDEPLWEGVRVGAFMPHLANAIEIPRPRLQAIVHVKTYDDADNATTWDPQNYYVDTASVPGRLVARRGQVFPIPTRAANGIEIEFTAGYGSSWNDVPERLRVGMMRLIAHLYEHRELVVTGTIATKIPGSVQDQWAHEQVKRFL